MSLQNHSSTPSGAPLDGDRATGTGVSSTAAGITPHPPCGGLTTRVAGLYWPPTRLWRNW
jgi:hypothetical protein